LKILKINHAQTAAGDDWIRASRLKLKAEAGDEEAAKELKEMENCKMIRFDKQGNQVDL